MRRRFVALLAGALVIGPVAGFAHAAEVVGTVVSTDPTASTVVVRTSDGKETIYRTTSATRIEQGSDVVTLSDVDPGSQVHVIVDSSAATPDTAMEVVVVPVQNGIVVAPTLRPWERELRKSR